MGNHKNLIRVFSGMLSLALVGQALATNQYEPEPQEVLTGEVARPWEAVERHLDPHPRLPEEPFFPGLTHKLFPPVAKAFGTDTPTSGAFLLHRAPGWQQAANPTPVLLIPGANDDATRRYAHPESPHGDNFWEVPGLMQYLAAKGHPTFAISFSHYHGDNILQGEMVANAIRRIRRLMGQDENPDFKVDLVTFSKGAMAARCYLQDASQFYPRNEHLTPYRGDVRRVVFQCGPLGGLDMQFRYYMYNLSGIVNRIPAPMGASKVLVYGMWKKAGKQDIFSGFWTGQLQMLADLRELGVPHGPLSFTGDANLSQAALMKGGKTFFLYSRGLEAAIEAGGNLIAQLNERGLHPDVEAAAVGGTFPVLYDERYPSLKLPVGAQFVDTNDGLVFLKSALYTKGLTARGAKIIGTETFPKNHIDLSRHEPTFAFVAKMLRP